jgi:ABC-2 type transport system permease protein
MIFRLYKTRLKCLVKDKVNLFWALLFPIVLSSFFSLAFSKLYSSELFSSIPVAVVEDEAYINKKGFSELLKNVSISDSEDGTKLFKVTECSEDKAEELLDNNVVIGYILLGDETKENETKFIVKESGIEQTIVKSFLDKYSQIKNTITSIVKENPSLIQTAIKSVSNQTEYIKEAPDGKKAPDTQLNYYYALIGMACLFGSNWGLKEITNIQANLSSKGARINAAPINKMKLLLCNFLAALTVQFAGVLILLAYLSCVIKVEFGSKLGLVLLTCFIANIASISLGAMVSAIIKKGENIKSAILLAITLGGSFLSGLMMVEMKYIVSVKAPIMKYINPANLITDAFYSLYYYDTNTRFITNISILIAFSIVFNIVTYLVTRRTQYASI